jgi:hypothetical protein
LAASGQTKEDSLAIKKDIDDYVEGWATGNGERVRNAISPELGSYI